uniref:Uncharacterized protein n=1 Tax=Octopus bimaculoides TaxID=37653 RepID=A0A0L8GCU7_OCTBM
MQQHNRVFKKHIQKKNNILERSLVLVRFIISLNMIFFLNLGIEFCDQKNFCRKK